MYIEVHKTNRINEIGQRSVVATRSQLHLGSVLIGLIGGMSLTLLSLYLARSNSLAAAKRASVQPTFTSPQQTQIIV